MPLRLALNIIRRIKGKMEQSREWSSALPLHHGIVAIEKRANGSPSTKVANLYIYIYIYVCVCVCVRVCVCVCVSLYLCYNSGAVKKPR